MNGEARRDAVEEAISQLRCLISGVAAITGPDWFDLDLTKGQVRTLFALRSFGTTSLSTLADRLGVGAPSTCVVVGQLVRRGYIERSTDPADHRRVMLRVATFGEELLTGLSRKRRQVLQAWLGELSDDELERLCMSLRPLARSVMLPQRTTPQATDEATHV